MKNIWLDGIMGVATGDALGLPAQFRQREELTEDPITGMETDSVFGDRPGIWSDDTSMTMAILDSLIEKDGVDPKDIMDKFVEWIEDAKYCAIDVPIDMGNTCYSSIKLYERGEDIDHCGRTGEYANGNGSLMRTLPLCIYYATRVRSGRATTDEAIENINKVSALTHNHERACIGCGLYFFLTSAILYEDGDLKRKLERGIVNGFDYYKKDMKLFNECINYSRVLNLDELKDTDVDLIKSSGYVVDSFEAAVWSLITTDSFKDCMLTAVNLGDDADTVGAIAGGLAGLYYGYDSIPKDWVDMLCKKEWLIEMCDLANSRL